MVWNGFVLVPAVLVYWPVRIGTFWPTLMVASSLSRVIRFGVDRMLALPSDSSACATAPRPSAPLICLKMPTVRPPVGKTLPPPVAMAPILLVVPAANDCSAPTR